jgi:hypothetical protein
VAPRPTGVPARGDDGVEAQARRKARIAEIEKRMRKIMQAHGLYELPDPNMAVLEQYAGIVAGELLTLAREWVREVRAAWR